MILNTKRNLTTIEVCIDRDKNDEKFEKVKTIEEKKLPDYPSLNGAFDYINQQENSKYPKRICLSEGQLTVGGVTSFYNTETSKDWSREYELAFVRS